MIFNNNYSNNELSDKVLILARTLMKKDRVCIGGILLSHSRYVRILDLEEKNVNKVEPYQIGQIYDIKYYYRNNVELPHLEDIIVVDRNYFRTMYSLEFYTKLKELNLNLGCIKNLFDGNLNWDEQRGYLSRNTTIPNASVLITSLKYPLYKSKFEDRCFYTYIEDKVYKIRYVGEKDISTLNIVPTGTLIRFSIARWWTGHNHLNKDGYLEERAYLQISGFYLD